MTYSSLFRHSSSGNTRWMSLSSAVYSNPLGGISAALIMASSYRSQGLCPDDVHYGRVCRLAKLCLARICRCSPLLIHGHSCSVFCLHAGCGGLCRNLYEVTPLLGESD